VVTGRIGRFDPASGCGSIEPDGGSPSVFVHIDDLGGMGNTILGTRVKFSQIQGRHGPKAYNVQVLSDADDQNERRLDRDDIYQYPLEAQASAQPIYAEEVRAVLRSKVPGITAAQTADVCSGVTALAARRGWLG
jgi:cold shock CspA family protein